MQCCMSGFFLHRLGDDASSVVNYHLWANNAHNIPQKHVSTPQSLHIRQNVATFVIQEAYLGLAMLKTFCHDQIC